MRGFPPPREQRVRLDQVYADPRLTHWYMQHAREVNGTADLSCRHGPIAQLTEDPMDLDGIKVSRADGEHWTLDEMLRATCVDAFAVLQLSLIHI